MMKTSLMSGTESREEDEERRAPNASPERWRSRDIYMRPVHHQRDEERREMKREER